MTPHRYGTSNGSSIATNILEGARVGSAESWRQIASLFAPLILRWCINHRVPLQEADDIVQNVFYRVFNRIAGFRRDRATDTFRGWLWTITHHAIMDYRRAHGRQATSMADLDFVAAPAAENANSEWSRSSEWKDIGELLRRAVDLVRTEFEVNTWTVFVQVVIDGRAPGDVASDCGISRNAVYIAKARILKRLRDLLGEP